MNPEQSKKLAVVVSQFPCVDETFILREMKLLAEAGFDFQIYTIKKSKDKVVQEQAVRHLHRVVYRNFLLSLDVLMAQMHFITRRPVAYCRVLFSFITSMWPALASLAKCCVLYPKAVAYTRHMQRCGISHVHAFWASYPAAVAWVAHHLGGLSYSFSAHAHDLYQERAMVKEKLLRARFVITCTACNKTHLTRLAPQRAADIYHVYHGINLRKFADENAPKKNENETLRILSVGTLYKTKGFDILVKACSVLRERRIRILCRIVGDGQERRRLQRDIAEFGLQGHVEMLGYLPQEHLQSLRRWATVFILLPRPYLHWGLPNVYIEAMASGLPVIATPLNAVPELIRHEETGLIVESDNPVAAADAMQRLYLNPEERRRLAKAGRRAVFDLLDERHTAPQFLDIFSRYLTIPAKPGGPREPGGK